MTYLHHFTSARRLPLIVADGFLRPTTDYLPFRLRRADRAVVWFTLDDDPLRENHGLGSDDITTVAVIRFTVELTRGYRRWYRWAASQHLNETWLARFNAAPGTATWYVAPRRVPLSEWLEVIDLRTGRPVSIVSTVKLTDAEPRRYSN